MRLRVAVQMDDIASINPKSDTTLALMHEAQARGYELWYYVPKNLRLQDGAPYASAQRISVKLEQGYFHIDPPEDIALAEMNVVLMRQDPPFDLPYITATHLLELVHPKTRVVNDPFAVRNLPEKLFALHFPEFTPPTLISANADDIRAFHREQGEIVIKPLYGFGGHGVFHIGANGDNLEALIEMYFAQSREPLMIQRFLPEVGEGERRIIMIGGEYAGIFGRIPKSGDIRSNLRIGGTPVKAELTPRQRDIVEALGPVLCNNGIVLAGVDVIGDWLTEINITSPTGLRAMAALYGTNPQAQFWDKVERM